MSSIAASMLAQAASIPAVRYQLKRIMLCPNRPKTSNSQNTASEAAHTDLTNAMSWEREEAAAGRSGPGARRAVAAGSLLPVSGETW